MVANKYHSLTRKIGFRAGNFLIHNRLTGLFKILVLFYKTDFFLIYNMPLTNAFSKHFKTLKFSLS